MNPERSGLSSATPLHVAQRVLIGTAFVFHLVADRPGQLFANAASLFVQKPDGISVRIGAAWRLANPGDGLG